MQNTLKTTSAMKMIASAKLHRVQSYMEALAEYEKNLSEIVAALCSDPDVETASPLAVEHKERRKAVVVAFASDNSLCGSFNANAFKQLSGTVASLEEEGYGDITVYPIGEKMVRFASKSFKADMSYRSLADKPSFDGIAPLADMLMRQYVAGEVDLVYTVYNHFHSMGRQIPSQEQVLPFNDESLANQGRESATDYILEPGPDELLASLLPSEIRVRFYRTLLDSITAENAARMIAMQTASDNAQELIDDLSLEYNKRRQQAITAELSDITSSL